MRIVASPCSTRNETELSLMTPRASRYWSRHALVAASSHDDRWEKQADERTAGAQADERTAEANSADGRVHGEQPQAIDRVSWRASGRLCAGDRERGGEPCAEAAPSARWGNRNAAGGWRGGWFAWAPRPRRRP